LVAVITLRFIPAFVLAPLAGLLQSAKYRVYFHVEIEIPFRHVAGAIELEFVSNSKAVLAGKSHRQVGQ